MTQLALGEEIVQARPSILIGTSSWTDKSLVQSGWYPKGVNSAEERLRFYAEHFPIVEVDSTYYFLPTEHNAQLWAQRSPAGFTFNIKAFSALTGHPIDVRALPDGMLDDGAPNTGHIYPNALSAASIDQLWELFLDALTPLVDAGKLGVVLFQFPPWFTCTTANRDYVKTCAERAKPLSICVEFRHESWLSDENARETLSFLREHNLPFVCVDMPQGFKSSVPPICEATSDLAVIRFHGRNVEHWESKSVQQRFAYDYSDNELGEWAPRIAKLSESVRETHVLMNNCRNDWAQKNARSLIELLQ